MTTTDLLLAAADRVQFDAEEDDRMSAAEREDWPSPQDSDWRQTLAASQQCHDEWRIRYAQDAEDEAAQ